VTPARSLLIAMVALALLAGTRPIAGIEQFPRGLLAAEPREGSCTIETPVGASIWLSSTTNIWPAATSAGA